ncbi:hypothetical protein pb186bvf_008859 [Paramecium bursaria]
MYHLTKFLIQRFKFETNYLNYKGNSILNKFEQFDIYNLKYYKIQKKGQTDKIIQIFEKNKIKKIKQKCKIVIQNTETPLTNLQYYDKQKKNSVVFNHQGKEVVLPKFQSIEDYEQLIPKSIQKNENEPYQQRISQLEFTMLEQKEQEDDQIVGQNILESQFLYQQLQQEKVNKLNCYFQNDFYMCFKNTPSQDDLKKRAQIMAKLYMKHHLIKDQNKVIEEIQKLNEFSEDFFKKEESETVQPQTTTQIQQQQEPQDTNEYENSDLSYRIQDLYKQITKTIDRKIYLAYEENNINQCIFWKQRKNEIESDMKNIV